jgi:hypothetical protein
MIGFQRHRRRFGGIIPGIASCHLTKGVFADDMMLDYTMRRLRLGRFPRGFQREFASCAVSRFDEGASFGCLAGFIA